MTAAPEDVAVAAIRPGTRLGRYEIVALIGKGGMGEVYRARDTELQRDVALKVLPQSYGGDPDRLRRFEHEARAMGQLSHANIVAIYDVGNSGNTPFVVTELLEGQTLRELLTHGPLERETAASYALQIARGLAAAHAKGIIHRDLKPANVFVTRHDEIKILDFGLAKLIHPEWDRIEVSQATISMTTPGVVLGTAAYMPPEQLEGGHVDFRGDLFAFGAILYEMLTGTRAFDGTSPASVAAAILREQPRYLTAEPSRIPAPLLSIVKRCLEKTPEARFQSARDLIFALEQQSRSSVLPWATSTMQVIRETAAKPAVRRGALVSGLTVSLLAILLLTTSPGSQARQSVRQPPSLRLTRITTDGKVLATDGGATGISPDGVYIAYIAKPGSIWLRHVPTGSEVQIVPPSNVDSVRISPDRNFIYYTASDESGHHSLYRVPLLGGTARKIADDVNYASPVHFSPTGELAFTRSTHTESSVWIANADGTGARKVVGRSRKEIYFHVCAWSPDATQLACSAEKETPLLVMAIVDVATGVFDERRGFFSKRANYLWSHEWVEPGTIIGASNNGIWKVPLSGEGAKRLTNDISAYADVSIARDTRTICAAQTNTTYNVWRVPFEAPGQPQLLFSGFNTQDGVIGISPLHDGRFLYASYESGKSLDIWIANPDGTGRKRVTEDDSSDEVWPTAAPDDSFFVYIRRSEGSAFELWRAELNGDHARKLTDWAEGPSITPDGQWIYFTRNESGGPHLFRISAGGGNPERITNRTCAHVNVSPDGRWLLASCREPSLGMRTVVWRLDGSGAEKIFGAGQPHRWSPDSRGFAYTDSSKGRNLWYQPLDGSAPVEITNFSDEGHNFAWARDGKSLYVPRWQSATDVVIFNETELPEQTQ